MEHDQPSKAAFATTQWTQILRARHDETQLEDLLRRYWSPIYAYLRRRGHDSHEAADLTQGFMTDVILRRDLLLKSDPRNGRFRGFLRTAVRNYAVDQHRREHGRAGNRPRLVPLDSPALQAAEPGIDEDPTDAFDRQWATTVFNRALDQLKESCHASGQARHWQIFEQRILVPIQNGTEPPGVTELAERLGIEDPADVSSMLYTVKRKFKGLLRQSAAETVSDMMHVDDEVADLHRILGIR